MRTKPLLVAILLAVGGPSSLFAQDRLPADWDQKVLEVVKDPVRAKKVVEAGRKSEEGRQQAVAAVRRAHEKLMEVFDVQSSQAVDREISIKTFRNDRRKAAFLWIDPIYNVGPLVTKKEWRAIWPEGFFAFPQPPPSAAVRIQNALPSVVADPARQQDAMGIASALVKAASANDDARKKETSRIEKLLKEGGIPRDECISAVDKLEAAQEKMDDQFITGTTRLQKTLTPDEWATLMRALKATAR
jgi:hypothetical protein